ILSLELHRIGRPDFFDGFNRLVGAFAAFMPRYTDSFVFIGDHPMPNPTRNLPPDRISRVVNRRASKTGLYQGRLRTPVPSAMRPVCAAANVSVSRGSSTLLYWTGKEPSPSGYGARGLSGQSMRSRTQRLSKPKSSARLATMTSASGPAAEPTCGSANPKRITTLLDHSRRAWRPKILPPNVASVCSI